MSSYKEGQIHQLANALEAEGFTPGEITAPGQNLNGVLTDLKLVLRGSSRVVREKGFKLDCRKPFSAADLNKGWTIWQGPADGSGLEGEEDRDFREDGLPTIDWEQVLLETHLQEGEYSVNGEEKLRRAIANGNIQLGGRALQSLWENYQTHGENSVLERLRDKGVTRMYFFGLRLRGPNGERVVMCLFFHVDLTWRQDFSLLSDIWYNLIPSVSLASD